MKSQHRIDQISQRLAAATPGECILYTDWVTKKGYANLKVNGKVFKAHRWAYESVKGSIAPGLTIDHLCGVKNCVNPFHLEAVTNGENIRRSVPNRVRMGVVRGTRNGRAKLTEDAVRQIRKSKETNRALASKFGVSDFVICATRKGKLWKHVK